MSEEGFAMNARPWSAVSTLIVLAFAVAGIAELAGGHTAGGIICLVLAVAYILARLARGRLLGRLRMPGPRSRRR
jgi:hypothetical protein